MIYFYFYQSEIIKEVSDLADKQGWAVAVLVVVLLAIGSGVFWVIKYLVSDLTKARVDFTTTLKDVNQQNADVLREIQEQDAQQNTKMIEAIDKLSDVIRDSRPSRR